MSTVFYTNPGSNAHTLDGHPEFAGRLKAVMDRLHKSGLMNDLKPVPEREITREEILLAHQEKLIELLELTTTTGQTMMIGADTYVLPVSYPIARMAAGGLLNIVDQVIAEKKTSGLATIRPPGHHATPEHPMGFCLINNIAIAAAYARKVHNLKRIAIVDFDVHHGNGSQDIFYDQPDVLFISSHESPLYPGTGLIDETGTEKAKGTTINIPVRAGTGDSAFRILYRQITIPALKRFKPELILVSAGFDAHWRDPLARLRLSLKGFAGLTRLLIKTAQEICQGKIIFVMEGGYDLDVLSYGILNTAFALLGRDDIKDPLGRESSERELSPDFLRRLKKLHQLPE